MHNGTIEAFSEGRDRGSTFVIRIPLACSHPESQPIVGSDSAASYPVDDSKSSRQAKMRVVLVEDIDDNREMLQAILELDGHQVVAVKNGETGLDAIIQHKPEVALIDIGLPGMDGYEVARRVRCEPACAGVRLIALTGYGQQSDIANALEAGFDAHLVKPVEPNALDRILDSETR
jgi:two-component system CheB/CheR fusion protein